MSTIAWLVFVGVGLFLLDRALPASLGIAALFAGLLVVLATWRQKPRPPVRAVAVALVVLALVDLAGQAGLTPLVRIQW